MNFKVSILAKYQLYALVICDEFNKEKIILSDYFR